MQSLASHVDSLSIVSTHEHHRPFPPEEAASLEYLFSFSYINWSGLDFSSPENRGAFLDLMAGKSYFVWYEKALDDLFDFGGEITVDNWDSISEKIAEAFGSRDFHEDVFANKCRYDRAILDAYWCPGSDNHRPDLYAPTFRINSFLYGNHFDSCDHNGHNAQHLYGACNDFDEYLAMTERTIADMKDRGCVALKSALAYDREICFKPESKRIVERIFRKPHQLTAPEELKCFGNFMFDYICTVAGQLDLPIQCHTGLAKLDGSHPMHLIPMIERHSGTKFVLMHGGYPWIEEIAALSHNYANVYADICWLPAISPSAAARALHSLIEAARDSSRITWGGDCWFVTESYGHSIAARTVLKGVLSEKVDSGYLSEPRAMRLAERILRVNAEELYGLSSVGARSSQGA